MGDEFVSHSFLMHNIVLVYEAKLSEIIILLD